MSETDFPAIDQLVRRFRGRFATAPRIFRAPGRINIIGEHTDYSDGLVMPAAIDRWTVVAAAPNNTRRLTVFSAAYQVEMVADLDALKPCGTWMDYVAGVASVLAEDGIALSGANLMIESNIPIGVGISSSAAIEVATAVALLSLTGQSIDGLRTARWAQRAENRFVGMPCGIMDQFIAANGVSGHALLLDCSTLDATALPLPGNTIFLLVNSMVRHSLVAGEYAQCRRDCETAARLLGVPMLRTIGENDLTSAISKLPPRIGRRCRHVVTENARVRRAATALKMGDMAELGDLMNDSHASLRDDMQVSVEPVDLLVKFAQRTKGVFGARLMGGGFGGCIIALVAADAAEDAAQVIAHQYEAATGAKPDTYSCGAVGGAHEIAS